MAGVVSGMAARGGATPGGVHNERTRSRVDVDRLRRTAVRCEPSRHVDPHLIRQARGRSR